MEQGKFVKIEGFECPNCGYLNEPCKAHYAECDNCKTAYEQPERSKSDVQCGVMCVTIKLEV